MWIAGVAQWQSSGIVNHRQKFDSSHQLKIMSEQKRAVRENFLRLGDTESGSIIKEALTDRIILSGVEGAKHFIEGMTLSLKGKEKGRAVSLLSGMIAKEKYDLEQKKKRWLQNLNSSYF